MNQQAECTVHEVALGFFEVSSVVSQKFADEFRRFVIPNEVRNLAGNQISRYARDDKRMVDELLRHHTSRRGPSRTASLAQPYRPLSAWPAMSCSE